MTGFWKLILTAAAALPVLAACDDGTVTPAAPELGEITVSQEKIGVGHQIVLTVEDKTPVVGNLYSIDPVWTINGSEILDLYTSYTMYSGKGRYTCYYVPMNTGTMEVTLNVGMRFNDAPAGYEEQSASTTVRLEVVECDARSSFWGDSAAITMYREPGLVKRGSSDVYIGEGSSSISGITNYNINSVDLTYTFENGGLTEISELFRLSSSTGGYSYVMDVFDFAVRTLETKYAGGSYEGRNVVPLDASQSACIAAAGKYAGGGTLTSDEKALLGEGIVRGWVRIVLTMGNPQTDITFTTGATEVQSSGGTVDVVLTYSRK